MEINIDEVKELKIQMWQKEQGLPPQRCVVEIVSPVSTDFIALYINGKRYEYVAENEVNGCSAANNDQIEFGHIADNDKC